MNENKAGFLVRFFAFLIDNFALGVLAFVVSFVFGPLIGLTAGTDSGILSLIASTLFLVMLGILFLLQFLYYGYFWSRDGQSVGMKLLSIRVVSQDGGALSFWRAGFRGTIGYWISGVFFSLGYLWALLDANNEAWHDKLFNTWVQVG